MNLPYDPAKFVPEMLAGMAGLALVALPGTRLGTVLLA